MSHFKHGANVPDTMDADFRIIPRTTNSWTQRITRVPDRPPLTYVARMLTTAPILLSMGGGALNIWSGKAAMLGAMAGLLLLVALNVWVDLREQGHSLASLPGSLWPPFSSPPRGCRHERGSCVPYHRRILCCRVLPDARLSEVSTRWPDRGV